MWHHTPHKTAVKGPGMFTGMVDLTRDDKGKVHARLLDLVPGRTGKAYATWLTDPSPSFRAGVKVATLDPFRGYANALRDELSEAVPVLDAFHVVGSLPGPWTRSAAAFSKTPSGTAAVPGTRSTAFATSCTAPPATSPNASGTG